MKALFALVALVLVSMPAAGASWQTSDGQAADPMFAKEGKSYSWTEAGTTDSGVICAPSGLACDNTGSTDFTVFRSTLGGTLLSEWLGPILDGGSCSPDAGTDTCGVAEGPAGCYVFSPDATGASATCWVPSVSGGR